MPIPQQFTETQLRSINTNTVRYSDLEGSLAGELLRARETIKELQQSLVKQNRLEEALLETGEKLAKRVC